MKYTVFDSPVGSLMLAGDESVLRELWFLQGRQHTAPNPAWSESARAFAEPVRQLKAYFAGRLRAFDLAVDPAGTAFQTRVWTALREIPYGETISYGELARRIGDPKAVRAVGLANGANPVSIVIPCHRVIGANGTLVGYGGGLPIKRALLSLEQGQGALL
ncbi:MAG: methylated-DNA--[protein]-cysteine S-methyltransferase [Acidobacteria bacterium]|nr:methylated-DNA--[protein]-cysteine S-methyltransferase [Acidobacteriota bacterium]